MAPYTLTGAQDWPMLVGMLKTMSWIFGALLATIMALIVAQWTDLRRQYSTHKSEEDDNCSGCHETINRELDAVWDTLESCCPRGSARPVRCRRKADKT